MVHIPLHSLVLLFTNESTNQIDVLPHQYLSVDKITLQLCGNSSNQVNGKFVWHELRSQCELRLSMGQTVAVAVDQIRTHQLLELAHLAARLGASVFCQTGVTPPSDGDAASLRQLKKNSWVHMVEHVSSWATQNPILPRKLLAVGDVHGNWPAMVRAWEHAQSHDLFVVWLGDIVDYGSQNLKCVKLAYDSVRENRAVITWGNHERKISRWIDSGLGQHYSGRLSDANRATISEIQSISSERVARFRAAWKCLESASRQTWQANNWLFTHGAAHKSAWDSVGHRLPGLAGEMAFFGEVDRDQTTKSNGYPNRVWRWVDEVPSHKFVVVGHEWVNNPTPVVAVKHGIEGGVVICVDTGSSKGGTLSAVEIDTQTNNWECRSF